MTQTILSPDETGEIQLTDDPTRDLTRLRSGPRPSPLPRTELADTLAMPLPKRAGVFLADTAYPDLTHPDTMPVPPRPPTKFQPDAPGTPPPFPAPVPAGPKPRELKVLVPLEPREPGRYVGRHRDPLDREGASGYVGRHVRPSMLGRVFGAGR